MQDSVVSIITPVYNAERFLKETIQSILDQSYKKFELILVDDCSTDNSERIIKNFSERDQRIKYVKLESNSGAAVARNTGLKTASGEYVAFLDSDDVWKSTKLEKQLAFMQQKNIGFTYTAFETIDEDGQIIKKRISVPEKVDYSSLLKNTAIACSTVVINRKNTGCFEMPLVRKGQDTATWLKLLRTQIDYAYGINDVMSSYRKVSGSISDNKLSALKRTWNTYRNIERLSFGKAAYYFSWYVLNAIKKRV